MSWQVKKPRQPSHPNAAVTERLRKIKPEGGERFGPYHSCPSVGWTRGRKQRTGVSVCRRAWASHEGRTPAARTALRWGRARRPADGDTEEGRANKFTLRKGTVYRAGFLLCYEYCTGRWGAGWIHCRNFCCGPAPHLS